MLLPWDLGSDDPLILNYQPPREGEVERADCVPVCHKGLQGHIPVVRRKADRRMGMPFLQNSLGEKEATSVASTPITLSFQIP